jgi:hypothetical protein
MNHRQDLKFVYFAVLFVFLFSTLKGCGDANYHDRYDQCMDGCYGKLCIFKSLFCIWS